MDHTTVNLYFVQLYIYFFPSSVSLLAILCVLFVVLFSRSSLVGSFACFNVVPLSPVHRVFPLQLAAFQQELAHHAHRAKVQYVLEGIAHGFSSGFDPSRVALRSSLRNMRSTTDHPDVIDEYFATEIAKSRVAVPFATPPFPSLHCSPFGVIPKKGPPGKWRLILDLSSPTQHSVNDGIPKDPFSLQYISVDDAIKILMVLGPGALMAKFDVAWRARIATSRCVPRNATCLARGGAICSLSIFSSLLFALGPIHF